MREISVKVTGEPNGGVWLGKAVVEEDDHGKFIIVLRMPTGNTLRVEGDLNEGEERQLRELLEESNSEDSHCHFIGIGTQDMAGSGPFIDWLVSKGHTAGYKARAGHTVDGLLIARHADANTIFNKLWSRFVCESANKIAK